MKVIYAFLGWALFLWFGFSFASGYGSRWECGRYFMPRSLVAQDGCSYPSGLPIPEPLLAIARSGLEEELELMVLVLCVGMFFRLGVQLRKLRRSSLE